MGNDPHHVALPPTWLSSKYIKIILIYVTTSSHYCFVDWWIITRCFLDTWYAGIFIVLIIISFYGTYSFKTFHVKGNILLSNVLYEKPFVISLYAWHCIQLYFYIILKGLSRIMFSSFNCSTFNLFNALKEYLSRHNKIFKTVDK